MLATKTKVFIRNASDVLNSGFQCSEFQINVLCIGGSKGGAWTSTVDLLLLLFLMYGR